MVAPEAQLRRALGHQSLIAMGRTAPNPPVACVVVDRESGKQLGAGATEPPGGRHAEIVAIESLPSGLAPGSAVLHVSLEPCAHQGRTPPCTERILETPAIGEVVYYARDPGAGRGGHARLEQAGCLVRRSSSFNAGPFLGGYLRRLKGQGPRFHLKLAVSADGYIGVRGRRLTLSRDGALSFGQLLRAHLDAVLVGPGTLVLDGSRLDFRPATVFLRNEMKTKDPFLNELLAMGFSGLDIRDYQPARIFLSPPEFAGRAEHEQEQERITDQVGGRAVYMCPGADLPDLAGAEFPGSLRARLGAEGLNDVLVEGGSGLLLALERELGSGDRLYLLRSERTLRELGAAPDDEPVPAPEFMLEHEYDGSLELGSDRLYYGSCPG